MDRKIDFGEAVGGAFKFGIHGFLPLLRLAWLPLAVVIGGVALLVYGGGGLGGALFGDAETFFDDVFAGVPLAAQVENPLALGLGIVLVLLGSILFVPVYVGLVRRAAGQADVGGWRFDGRAWRVIGAALITGLLFLAAVLIIVVPFSLLGAGIGDTPGGVGIVVLVLLGIAAFVAFVVIAVRLTLFVPMAATENRIALGDAWSATSGNFWVLLGGLLVTSIGASIVGAILEFAGALFAEVGGGAFGAVGIGVLVVFYALSQAFQNLVAIGYSGSATGQLRGYGTEEVGDVFA